ncbi:Hsp20/alpha crystallin family protein [Sorangium sp. So ce233]|uniref:Hsp20/alpha crystallin family protein n=1 Tax=Sorangium sp. So ce233 TaxID=3133290 RepID=UPI003F60A607
MLSRYTPWFSTDAFSRPFRPFFDLGFPWSLGADLAPTALAGAPQVDILENDGGVELVCDVPGCGPDDIGITAENGVLTIHARRKAEAETEGAAMLRSERYHGEFTRSFALGEHYDMDQVSASLQNGVLTVKVAKRPEATPRRIPIRLGAEGMNKQLGGKSVEAESEAAS